MEELLFLPHRIPYPPNKGDKIRSYHLLRHLAAHFVVHVGTFIDDDADWQHVGALKSLCPGGEVFVRPLRKMPGLVRSLRGFLTGEALTLPYYRDAVLREWVDGLLATRPIRRAVVFSSPMAQYLEGATGLLRIADLVDVDSAKWAEYAEKQRGPKRWVYRRESEKLLAYEKHVAATFDATYLVSPAEAALLRRLAPEIGHRVHHFCNGVDADFFSPERDYASPFVAGEEPIVFTGAMDYWPNIDAVTWFAREVLPRVRQARPAAVFYVVGSRPAASVQELATLPGVKVTGTVPDVRPYVAHASVMVAPLRIARGIQNKVLEAMAMERPTVVTPDALEGIEATSGAELLLADEDAPAFAKAVAQVLETGEADIGAAARRKVLRDHAWPAHLDVVIRALGATARKAAMAPQTTGGDNPGIPRVAGDAPS